MFLKKIWAKYKIRRLRQTAHFLYPVGKFGDGFETNQLAEKMECELKGLEYKEPELGNPFLDDEGNLRSGFVPSQMIIKQGTHPAIIRK